ncbi:MAG: SurA N-terminal domain-containing protein [Polyangia bacterium]
MRRNSRSAIVYVLFGILIAAFVLFFGAGSGGLGPTNASATVAAKVQGSTLSEQDFQFAYIAAGGSNLPPKQAKEQRIKEMVMDKLIERELLAQEADKLGFQVSQKEVEDMVADGRMLVMGYSRRIDNLVTKNGAFDYERFKLMCTNQLGVSVMRFIEIEQRELLADKMRESMKAGIRVSPAEVKQEFDDHGKQVNLAFVRFSSRHLEADEEPSAAELAAYEKTHEADLKKLYEERKPLLFTKVDKQAKLRHIAIDLPKDATADTTAKVKARIDEAKKALDDKKPFGDVAAQFSSNPSNQRRHGEMGWKKKGFTGFNEAVDAKVFAAKKGDVIGPERTDRAYEIILVEDLREGDVTYDQAVGELAEQELLRDKAKQKAKSDAQAALDRVRKGEKLDVMFPVKKDDSTGDKSPEANFQRMLAAQSEEPQIKETGLFSRRGEIVQGIGVSKELARQAFDLKQDEVAGPFEVASAYVLVQVKEKKEPDDKDFEKRRRELEDEAERVKWSSAVSSWARNRCLEVRDAGHIHIANEILAYEGTPNPRPGQFAGDTTAYVPCAGHMPF